MQTHRIIGIAIIIIGIIMFLVGASMFTYTGNLNPIVSKIGMYSFFCWLPTLSLGVILFAIKKKK